MRAELEERYVQNLQRVRALVQIYRELGGGGSGRRAVEKVDVLRAAVVFLHATLEDVLRALLSRRWRLAASAQQFADIPIAVAADGRHPAKIGMPELMGQVGKSVDELVQQSIDAYLERSNYNNLGEVKAALTRSGLSADVVAPTAKPIAAMMSRRHQIVHRADRQDAGGSGNHVAASLGVGAVEAWILAVERLLAGIVARL